MSKQQKKNTNISVTSDIASLPASVQKLAEAIQEKHSKCWCPETNALFPCCVVEKDPKSVDAMMCLRVLTLDRERYIGFITWYASKMKEQMHLLRLAMIAERLLRSQATEGKEEKKE